MKNNIATKITMGFGALIGLWSVVAFTSALYSANGNLAEVIRGYMVATGMITPLHNLVDYYTHIKGVEYLICVVFFVAFPIFYRGLNDDKDFKTANS